MSSKTTYVPGKTTSFTPSRNAQWTEDFYDLQLKTGLNKSALTEQLIIKGLAVTSPSNLNLDVQIVDLNEYTEEEIQLISTTYFKNQINQYVSYLLDQHKNLLSNSHENFIFNKNENTTKRAVQTGHVENTAPVVTSNENAVHDRDKSVAEDTRTVVKKNEASPLSTMPDKDSSGAPSMNKTALEALKMLNSTRT